MGLIGPKEWKTKEEYEADLLVDWEMNRYVGIMNEIYKKMIEEEMKSNHCQGLSILMSDGLFGPQWHIWMIELSDELSLIRNSLEKGLLKEKLDHLAEDVDTYINRLDEIEE